MLETADAMTASAANALLKTLEEPSARTYLLLISHQPGRLPATIRSRCQSLAVQCPSAADAVAWLRIAMPGQARLSGRHFWPWLRDLRFEPLPLRERDLLKKNKYLQEQFKLIYEYGIDPQKVADEWLKEDIELALDWLEARLQAMIRARLAPDKAIPDGKRETEESGDAWRRWGTLFLFQQLQKVELLLRQLGGGINVDLATRSLLLEFQSQGGRQ